MHKIFFGLVYSLILVAVGVGAYGLSSMKEKEWRQVLAVSYCPGDDIFPLVDEAVLECHHEIEYRNELHTIVLCPDSTHKRILRVMCSKP